MFQRGKSKHWNTRIKKH